MPDICTIVGNTMTCDTSTDWLAAVVAPLIAALIGAVIGLGAALLANRHQRKEASKQRKITATSSIMRSAFNMVRSSHRDKHQMRDHASEFEIAIRMLSVELQSKPGEAFIRELFSWRRELTGDCRRLPEIDADGDHNTPDITDVRKKINEFADFLTEWLHLPDNGLARVVRDMRRERERLWPVPEPDAGSQPRLGAGGEGAELAGDDVGDKGLLLRGQSERAQDAADNVRD
jgi:fumarate reductase subunit D